MLGNLFVGYLISLNSRLFVPESLSEVAELLCGVGIYIELDFIPNIFSDQVNQDLGS